jgi:hypothetical protein
MVSILVGCAALGSAPAAAEPREDKGPYLQNLTPTSITMMWSREPARAGTITLTGPGLTGPGGSRQVAVAAHRISETILDDLTPASRYRYQVVLGSEVFTGEFATAPASGEIVPFSFVAFGDSRSNSEAHRRVVARVIAETPDFILGTGDMVDEGNRQDQWQQFFEAEEDLLRNTVLFPSLGNHDRQGRGRTADNYRDYFSLPENGTDSERCYAFTYASSRFLILDSNLHSFALTDQTAWIEGELSAARQDPAIHTIFVVMHHPPFSVSLHGGQRDLRERWTPLFERYDVTAVFSGHDHVYSRAEKNGVRYFVTGGGGAPLYPRSAKASAIDQEAVVKFERTNHFLRVNVHAALVTVTAVRSDGSIIESTSWGQEPGPAPVVAENTAPGTMSLPQVGAPSPSTLAPPPSSGISRWLLAGAALILLSLAALVALVPALQRRRRA